MRASLLVLVGKQKGHEIPLPETLFVIGRDPLCHLRPHSNLVSRRHCTIAHWGGRVLLRDMKSANGTFLNRKKLHGQATVQDGDILHVGDIAFAFQIAPDPTITRQLREDSVAWLMASDESEELDPTMSTAHFDVGFLDSMSETAAETSSDKGLSAGKYLKDYLGS